MTIMLANVLNTIEVCSNVFTEENKERNDKTKSFSMHGKCLRREIRTVPVCPVELQRLRFLHNRTLIETCAGGKGCVATEYIFFLIDAIRI